MAEERKSKSPYQRHKKSPYRYSEIYMRWNAATMAGREGEARRLAQEHSLRFFGARTPIELARIGSEPSLRAA